MAWGRPLTDTSLLALRCACRAQISDGIACMCRAVKGYGCSREQRCYVASPQPQPSRRLMMHHCAAAWPCRFASPQAGVYQVIYLNRTAGDAYRPLSVYKPFVPFRDASCGVSTFHLTVYDCIKVRAGADMLAATNPVAPSAPFLRRTDSGVRPRLHVTWHTHPHVRQPAPRCAA